jgi:hypothetical protein
MNEQELRVLVRQAITGSRGVPADGPSQPRQVAAFHPSHGRCDLPSGTETGGPCLIEPVVMCDHCGYCLSYGH